MLQFGVWADYVYACSGGAFAAMFYIYDWRRFNVTKQTMLDVIPSGRKAKEPGCCAWIGLCCRAMCARRRAAPVESGVGTDLARMRALDMVTDCLTRDGKDAYKRANGRLHLTVTRTTRCCAGPISVVVNEWFSNQDLLDCIRCTTDIPGRAGAINTGQVWRGNRWVDGGVEVIHPIRDVRTVCVTTSCFAIRPDQPAYHIKSRPPDGPVIGEIGQDIPVGSTTVFPIAFYDRLWDEGTEDAVGYIRRRAEHFRDARPGVPDAHLNEEFNFDPRDKPPPPSNSKKTK
jgi:hypothetical protein